MYQAIYYDRRTNVIHLWDDENGHATFPYPNYAYRRSATGKYKSIYGDQLEKIFHPPENNPDLFESDLLPEMRVLLDAYETSDDPSEGHRTVVIDIEVDSTGGFPNIEEGDKTITAITLYDYIADVYLSYILDPDKKIENRNHENVSVMSFLTEVELLKSFLTKWHEIKPTIVTGWNTNGFDMPYIFNRIRSVLGQKDAYSLSTIYSAYQNKYTKRMVIAGVNCLDYLDLYKKFSATVKPSYALGAVAKDEELKNQKLTYKGSLTDLYKTDLNRYIEYNLVDVKIVVELDKKYDFLYLARSVCHKGHIPYEWFQMSSRFIDGAILMYLHRNGVIAPNKPVSGREELEEMEKEGEDGFVGAYVKEPIPGLYDWICSADITSLYPSIIMSLNISPDTKAGKIRSVTYLSETGEETTTDKWNVFDFKSGKITKICIGTSVTDIGTTYTAEEFSKLLDESKFSISSNGVLYSQKIEGVVPSILNTWFDERVQYRELAKKYKKEGDADKAAFYNRRQLRQKIFLNSVYGSLGLPVFRFYDRDNAEATTLSGQVIIKEAESLITRIHEEKVKTANLINQYPSGHDYVQYIDTDSCYFSAVPLAKCEPTYPSDMKEFTIKTIQFISSEINTHYSRVIPIIFNISDAKNRIRIIADVVAEKAMWVAKKRYAMLKVYDMENMMDVKDKYGNSGKLEVKGIDTVRSSFPLAFKKIAGEVLEKLLRGTKYEDIDQLILKFEDNLHTVSVFDLGKTTSVKFISQKGDTNYNPGSRRPFHYISKTPVGVKSALAYNDLLSLWNLTSKYEKIHHGQKIKWVYLIPNQYGIDSIAFKGDETDPDEILEVAALYVDRIAMYESELKSKLLEFYKVMNREYPVHVNDLVKNMFGDSTEEW